MMAGPNNVQYTDYSHYFFQVGLRLVKLKRKPDEEADRINLKNTLRYAFAGERYSDLIIRALTRTDGQNDNTQYMLTLTDWESKLFKMGQQGTEEFHKWRLGNSWKIEPSVLVRKSQYEDMGGGKRTKY